MDHASGHPILGEPAQSRAARSQRPGNPRSAWTVQSGTRGGHDCRDQEATPDGEAAMTPCLIARRHLNADHDHDGTPATHGHICRSCYRRLEQRIAELPALCRWLEVNIACNGSAGERLSGSRDAPVPVSLMVIALLSWSAPDGGGHDPVGADGTPSIPAMLDSWVRMILEEDPSLTGPAKLTVDVMTVWLLARLAPPDLWLAEQLWVDQFVAELDRVHVAINAAAPYWPVKDHPRPTPCDQCDLRALVWNSRWYECDPRLGGCGRLMSQIEYDQLIQRWAAWASDQEVAI